MLIWKNKQHQLRLKRAKFRVEITSNLGFFMGFFMRTVSMSYFNELFWVRGRRSRNPGRKGWVEIRGSLGDEAEKKVMLHELPVNKMGEWGKVCGKIGSDLYRPCLFLRWFSPIVMIKSLYYPGYPSCSAVLFRGGLNMYFHTVQSWHCWSWQYAGHMSRAPDPGGLSLNLVKGSDFLDFFFAPRSRKMNIKSSTTNSLFNVQWRASL